MIDWTIEVNLRAHIDERERAVNAGACPTRSMCDLSYRQFSVCVAVNHHCERTDAKEGQPVMPCKHDDAPLKILYFAWLRERIGVSEEDLLLPEGICTVGDLSTYLVARGPKYAAALNTSRSVRCAVNQNFADLSSPVGPGDEVAFFPPVTGG